MNIEDAFNNEAIIEAGAQLTPEFRQDIAEVVESFYDFDKVEASDLINLAWKAFSAGMTYAVNEFRERGYGAQDPEVEVSMPLSEFVSYSQWLREQIDDLKAELTAKEGE